jgi:hypothetical protein
MKSLRFFDVRSVLRPMLCGFIALWTVSRASADDNDALFTALIRKGVLTTQEAEDIRADVMRQRSMGPPEVEALNKSTDRLHIGTRFHLQYANFGTTLDGATVNSPAGNHFFLRRMYLTVKGSLGANWSTIVTFDFANGSYDDANVSWQANQDLAFHFGLRKVNVAYEERMSSGNLKAIERSPVTRYFVDSQNGHRLGAGSYRIGAFLDGKRSLTEECGVFYSAAITNPERNETFSGAGSFGDGTNNRLAVWGTAGLKGTLANGTWLAGVGAGYLPDQGGFATTDVGKGFDLCIYSAVADINVGRLGLLSEFLTASVDRGAATPGHPDAQPRGFFVQPSLRLTDSVEAIIRYSWLNSAHRGVNLSDVVRQAPGAAVMNKFSEWFAGVNWYLKGNDLKYQLGVARGQTRDGVNGEAASAKTTGVRAQMQMQL